MAATAVPGGAAVEKQSSRSLSVSDEERKLKKDGVSVSISEAAADAIVHRQLTPRQIQLLALAGTVGAALFVGIGASLAAGGPLSLFLAVTIWTTVIWVIAHCQAEIVGQYPLDGSFIQLAGRFVDDAYGVMAGYNYFLYQAALICFDISAFTVVIGYWKQLNPAILTSVLIGLFTVLNIWSVAFYGEAEFWLAMGKLILILMCLLYTFISMVGGNPTGRAYGFTYWNNPGAMNEYLGTGALGRFQGFVTCMVGAAFLVAGPEYISMVAGEAKNPRKTMPRAFTTIIYRLAFFFVLGSLAVGIVVPYNDPKLLSASGPSGAGSPYVISASSFGIPVFPDVVNALIATSILSAANSYVYGTSRALYGLALQHRAPAIFRMTNRNGTPWTCVLATIALSCLSYLSVSAGSNRVLTWWVSLVSAGQLMNWLIMLTTWYRFNAGLKAQKIDKKSFLPYVSYLLPYGWYWAFIMSVGVISILGWETLLPGQFKADTFIFAYGLAFIDIIIYVVWKLYKRPRFVRASEMDFMTGIAEIEQYEAEYERLQTARPPTNNPIKRVNRWLFE